MATIVNNTPGSDSGNGAAGWVIAGVVIAALVLIALFVWPGYSRNGATPAATGGSVNVTLPAGGEGSSGGGAAQ
ncbi:MAG: hypothetical protein JWN64_857 [Parcubacteria group bacterium]|nr:hypothetical protein [Parcubacteria group bacterium]